MDIKHIEAIHVYLGRDHNYADVTLVGNDGGDETFRNQGLAWPADSADDDTPRPVGEWDEDYNPSRAVILVPTPGEKGHLKITLEKVDLPPSK